MTNNDIAKLLLTKSQAGGEDFAVIYNKVSMYLVNNYEICNALQALLCAAAIYDLREDPKIFPRKEKIDGKVNSRRGKAVRTGKASQSETQAD